ncbi:lyase family protein [Alcanivorax sp. 1008]|uniref:class II fumarate hydratase n=1 Tax=Alcanivorax sp. 1008 TaxID=2816853 RepID=UPI001DF2701C|nr:class II fumarate hydratase [Alcanivorax sp. 1008]MCC1496162.1 class II fumarate hydratase [Alcanivorax sp. 1008]
MSHYRTEKDSLGEVQVPTEALWGAQTQRAVNNFTVSRPLPNPFIRAIALIKDCAAEVNLGLGLLAAEKASAISRAATRIVAGEFADQFPVDVFQTGSGTSSNMNVNEVIAHICQRDGVAIHANDDVNLGQSSNDTIPTAIHLSSILAVTERLLPALITLRDTVRHRALKLENEVKPGRTHLMDAMPITFAQQLNGWAVQLDYVEEKLRGAVHGLLSIPQGGTAVGTGVNCHREFAPRFCLLLSQRTGQHFQPLDSFFAGQGAIDRPLALSSALRGLAVVLMKICNDLRWMNSGPQHGLAEIVLPVVQPGSSIMPGKVNPVICESVCMVAAQVMGLDQANAIAAQSGNFELNVMLPLVADNLLGMTAILANAMGMLDQSVMSGFQINSDHLAESIKKNPILVTALNPLVGYNLAAEIAKEAYSSGRPVIDVACEKTDLSREQLEKLLDPVKLTRGGTDF